MANKKPRIRQLPDGANNAGESETRPSLILNSSTDYFISIILFISTKSCPELVE